MRWFIAVLAALTLAWTGYLASPYLALRDLARAVAQGDEGEVAARVNFRALRHTLARHIVADLSATERSGALAATDVQLAAGALAAAADPLLESLLTPRGVVSVLRRAMQPEGQAPAARASGSGFPDLDRIAALLSASQWRGFRNVYFSLPPEAPRDSRYRLQLRLSRLTWRLVGIELPPEIRRRIAQEIVLRQRQRRN